MKYIYILFVFCLVAFGANAQFSDAQRRAILASYSIDKENFSFESPRGEACVNVILYSFRTFAELPTKLSMEGVSASDQLLCENLMAKLLLLQVNPPSWDELINIEENRLKEYDRRVNRHSKYPLIKQESISESQTLQTTSEQGTIISNPPQDNQISPAKKQKIEARNRSGN